jgi:hypothetical protein
MYKQMIIVIFLFSSFFIATPQFGVVPGTRWVVEGKQFDSYDRLMFTFNETYNFYNAINDIAFIRTMTYQMVNDTVYEYGPYTLRVNATQFAVGWIDSHGFNYDIGPVFTSINWDDNIKQWNSVRYLAQTMNTTYVFQPVSITKENITIINEFGIPETDEYGIMTFSMYGDYVYHVYSYIREFGILCREDWLFGNQYGNWKMVKLTLPLKTTNPDDNDNLLAVLINDLVIVGCVLVLAGVGIYYIKQYSNRKKSWVEKVIEYRDKQKQQLEQ